MTEDIELVTPTNRTIRGPKVSYVGSDVVAQYDFEQEDGTCLWARLTFLDVLSFDFRNDTCCDASDVLSSKRMRIQGESPYLESMKRSWKDRVGMRSWQQKQGGHERYKHFTVYFNDAGALNVISSSVVQERDGE